MPNEFAHRWPALWDLNHMAEEKRKPLLWFHRDGGLVSSEAIKMRQNLDDELEAMGRLELQAEAALGDVQQRAAHDIKIICKEFRSVIFESPAFGHYLDSYLYFKIRFAAGRFDNPCDPLPIQTDLRWNQRPVGLPPPPDCEPETEAAERHGHVEQFLRLQTSPAAAEALKFLDECVSNPEKVQRFDLWLRRLLAGADDEEERHFNYVARGMYEWARQRFDFYVDIERSRRGKFVDDWLNPEKNRKEGAWHARNPLTARCGVADLYWLARLLRAEVSPQGCVSYSGRSWLHYLPQVAPGQYKKEEIARIDDVLCAAFNYACELIQNAVEMAEYNEKRNAKVITDRVSRSADWRAVRDAEIAEVGSQRGERFVTLDGAPKAAPEWWGKTSRDYWSERVRTGEYEENLVGIAVSGGGIRSATFALGVLQRLKEMDLLRQADYLSTVSGGGYIGSWLLGNVRRTRYFLSRMTSWDESICHLRDYSKYLAPRSGFLSADTWVVWGTWIRNAALIQLTTIACLWTLFVAAMLFKTVFDWISLPGIANGADKALVAGFIALAILIRHNLKNPMTGRPKQHGFAVVLAWMGAFFSAALLWGRSFQTETFAHILKNDFVNWPVYVGLALLVCMFAFALVSTDRRDEPQSGIARLRRWAGSAGAAALSTGVIYLCLCGVRYLFDVWTVSGRSEFEWYAYVFGPPLVVFAVTIAVVIFIGIIGHNSEDWRREWWTRYGAWLAISGAGFLALNLAGVFGFTWMDHLWRDLPKLKWGALGGWAASTLAGLLSGHSGKTKGNGTSSSPVLEWVARIGGLVFIAGSVVILSSVLHLLLVQVWLDQSSSWWGDLNLLLLATVGNGAVRIRAMAVTLVALASIAALFSWRFNLNIFGLNQFYRNRLVRCYLGATRWRPGSRRPDRFTGFDEKDDLRMTELQFNSPDYPDDPFRGPFPIVNCALNLGGSSDLSVKTRQSGSFTITPLSAGSERSMVGYMPVDESEGSGVTLGQAISISGAAASPNMGYNTSPLVSILLTMFNVRLAWWFPNPGLKKWREAFSPVSILYLVQEFLGLADEKSKYVNISDGGHFENLAIYELIRRRVKVIIAADGECDSDLNFGSLGNVIRICETDFGAKIDIDVGSIRKQPNGKSRAHCAVGRIAYSNGSLGYLIYLKASITGDEDSDIEQYRAAHPDFPHQSTSDQFFTEDQFESYRRLGHHIASLAFRDAEAGASLMEIAGKLYDLWTPAGFSSDTFVKHTALLDQIWERFRNSSQLLPLLSELSSDRLGPERCIPPTHEELAACLELVQLMENVFLDLRLDDFWDHPDNRGWAMLFTMWARSPRFRVAWRQTRRTFGIRFEYFCQQHLGLEREQPVARV
ncbi:MAG: hypothetical protein JO307_26415 [Bryobacterales bacterium]|nr:hypothetical protein [Bryobacterales bacterium]